LAFLLSLAEGENPGTTADMLAERTGAEGERLYNFKRLIWFERQAAMA
jgi:hypothetical protein